MSRVLAAIAARDGEALTGLLADDVVFHSPVQTYRGREQVIHLLVTIGGILESVEETREAETVTFFNAKVEEHPLDGILDEQTGADGRVAQLTLLLRPLASLQAAVARMTRALADSG